MTVSKGSRSASASITLTVVEGNPPAVWVDLAQMKVKANERVKLDGYYNSSAKPDKVEWSCPPAQGAFRINDKLFCHKTFRLRIPLHSEAK